MVATEAVFLIMVLFTSAGGAVTTEEFPMVNMETCLKSVEAAKIDLAKGGDAEGAIALFCVNGDARKTRWQNAKSWLKEN